MNQTMSIKILSSTRKKMQNAGFDAMILFSSDKHFSSHVAPSKNHIFHVTGFLGSTSIVVIEENDITLFVDGRYHLQAEHKAYPHVSVYKSQNNSNLTNVAKHISTQIQKCSKPSQHNPFRIGLLLEQISKTDMDYLHETLNKVTSQVVFEQLHLCIDSNTMNIDNDPSSFQKNGNVPLIEFVPKTISGKTTTTKLFELSNIKNKMNIDMLCVSAMDDVSNILNVRYHGKPFSSAFPGFFMQDHHNQIHVWLHEEIWDSYMERSQLQRTIPNVTFFSEQTLQQNISNIFSTIKTKDSQNKPITIGISFSQFSEKKIRMFEHVARQNCRASVQWKNIDSILPSLKAIKTTEEIQCFKHNCQRTDHVAHATLEWLHQQIDLGHKISEQNFAEELEKNYRLAGAINLSFPIIAASGPNSAFVHYHHDMNNRIVKPGDLFLLDTGAYFEGGYATDLSRTVLVGKKSTPSKKQIQMYSLVWKACVNVLNTSWEANNIKGHSLDSLARSVLKQHQHDFPHSLGHGVGINVHEYPPAIGQHCNGLLKKGMIFSVEPGIYENNIGGVRIENLVVLESKKHNPSQLSTRLLSFCPLESRLLDASFFEPWEWAWSQQYEKQTLFFSSAKHRLQS